MMAIDKQFNWNFNLIGRKWNVENPEVLVVTRVNMDALEMNTHYRMNLFVLFFAIIIVNAYGATMDRPHTHSGVLEQFTGNHIGYNISLAQLKKLHGGEPVIIKETTGKSGRGIVIQDVHASTEIVFDRIEDLANYHKMVPNVKHIEIYDHIVYENETELIHCKFTVGVSLLKFSYFIKLIKEPQYNTYFWALDYRYSSDFDDNVGQWQVLPHPTKEGWSRVVYSVGVKLYSWVPGFVVTFLTNSALVEVKLTSYVLCV